MVGGIDALVDRIVHLIGFQRQLTARVDVVDAGRRDRKVGRGLVPVERADGTVDERRIRRLIGVLPMGAERRRSGVVLRGIHVADQHRGHPQRVVHLLALDDDLRGLRTRHVGQRHVRHHHEKLLAVSLVRHHGAAGDAVVAHLVPAVAHLVGRRREPEIVPVAQFEPVGIVGDAQRLAALAVLRIAADEPPFVVAALARHQRRQFALDRTVGLLESEDVPVVVDDRLR